MRFPAEPPRGRGLTETAPRNERLWDMEGFGPTVPRNQLWGINFDFSSFPVVCEATFEEILQDDPRMRRQMPFCQSSSLQSSSLER